MSAIVDSIQPGIVPAGVSDPIQRVLVVDDSLLERRLIVSLLKRWGYEPIQAENARDALEFCRSTHPDLILSDWMMPGMSGPEFCRHFRANFGNQYTYFILFTSKSSASEVAHGLNAGADDFLTKPVNSDELRARISAGERLLRAQRELAEKNRIISETLGQLQDIHKQIDADLKQARKIQDSLVPRLEDSYGQSRISLLLEPCGHIGGDLVGMFSPDRNRIGFYNIDVSGHGITSAMMTARLGSYLSATHFDQNIAMEKRFDQFYSLRQPAEVAALLNSRLDADTGIEEYFTMAYAIADLTTGLVRMVQAGHPHPMLIRHDGRAEFVGQGGVPIGLFGDVQYDQIEIVMQPGDRLLLYSDGLTECLVDDDSMLGEDGLADLVQRCADGSGRAFLDNLYCQLTERISSEAGMNDDVSATLFEYGGPEAGRGLNPVQQRPVSG